MVYLYSMIIQKQVHSHSEKFGNLIWLRYSTRLLSFTRLQLILSYHPSTMNSTREVKIHSTLRRHFVKTTARDLHNILFTLKCIYTSFVSLSITQHLRILIFYSKVLQNAGFILLCVIYCMYHFEVVLGSSALDDDI